jgi:protein-tyrosine phosphatase
VLRRALLVPAALAIALACATVRTLPAPAPATAVVERVGAERVRIRWPADFSSGPVRIYAGRSPDAIAHRQPIALVDGDAVELASRRPDGILSERHRLYYELVPSGEAAPVIVAERRLPLAGADNFRDLGGYATADGRRLRWGRLYRSNDLSGLTERDLHYLSEIGLRLVCDLRSDSERRAAPDRRIAPPRPLQLPLSVPMPAVSAREIERRIRSGGIAELGAEQVMLDSYRSFATDHADAWAALFARLADPRALPAVVHCTAGKDRTGFASALVLLSLGVPEETVYEDYLLSNEYRQDFTRFVLRWTPLYSLFRTEPEDVAPLLEARREYLDAALGAIRASHGSVDNYLEQALGVTPERRAAIEANLLR